MKDNRRIKKEFVPERRLIKRQEPQPQSKNPGTKKGSTTDSAPTKVQKK